MIGTDPVVTLDLWLMPETKCDYPHQTTPCTHEVTHRVVDCADHAMVCTLAANVILKHLAGQWGDRICGKCHKPERDCMQVLLA